MANTYGNNGNRWWVGLNVSSDQSDVFGLSTFGSPNSYESLPSGNAADDAQFAAAAAKDRGASKPVTISVENVSWYNINGPYTTQKAANAAIAAIQKAHPAAGYLQQVENEVVEGNGQAGANANPVTDPLTTLLRYLTSEGTWIRVAKVVIGGVLVIVGLANLTGTDKVITTAAKGALL